MEPMQVFHDREEFLARLRELRDAGHGWRDLDIHMPFHVHEVDEIFALPPGGVRFFALGGGVLGFAGGLAFVCYTVLSWPLITGGKPIVSVPPFLLIAYLLTILCGSLCAFGGFLLLARRPGFGEASDVDAHGDCFMVRVREEKKR
ncbi:quinol:electron acceptor oxidoreductase subunit ActD [Geoalkalibacter sp.]|uniref:quinol:electron acceptor oxidoreductase subunit ActD n=1 Tax=Geoalkalibacter sp. TaxID=3041440 RepID=UPI00272E3683|nr:quinol:electron acceptor oxidoreductase subunit ActD [Geoalkalibacter sp.]